MILKGGETTLVAAVNASEIYLTNYHGVQTTNKTTGGTSTCYYALKTLCSPSSSNYFSTSYINSFVDVGYGDTPETEDDYYLADGNKTNPLLTCVGSGKNSFGVGDFTNVYANFRNDGASPVVVKEVGILGNPTAASGDGNIVAFFRKVLDNPITIQPGETYSFQYNVRFKH